MSEAVKAVTDMKTAAKEAEEQINSILEFDRAAREKVAAAQERAEKIIADALARKKTLGDDNSSRIAEQAEGKFAAVRQKTDGDIAEYGKKADEKCRFLDEKMSAEKNSWKKEIIERILG